MSLITNDDKKEIGLWRAEQRKWGNKKAIECQTCLNSEIPWNVIINYVYFTVMLKVYRWKQVSKIIDKLAPTQTHRVLT